MNKKIIKMLLSVLVIIVMFSSCVSATYTISFNNDGTMNINYKLLANNKADGAKIDPKMMQEIKEEFIKQNYEVKEITENGLLGFEISKQNITHLNKEFVGNPKYNLDPLKELFENIEFKDGFLYDHYKINTNIDLSTYTDVSDTTVDDLKAKETNETVKVIPSQTPVPTIDPNKVDENKESVLGDKMVDNTLAKNLSELNLKFIISTEGSIKTTNATKISDDKKTAEWMLIPGQTNNIQIELSTNVNKGVISTCIIMVVCILLILVFGIIFIKVYLKRNR